jgi:signal transduction histidine kinase/ligand-binding sensor domain-containing protein/CheY-like chemotaxis protein
MNLSRWLALVLSVSQAWAAAPLPTQFVLDVWDTKTGIPEEIINSVTQTSDGYLWLTTANGLVQYDGNSFRIHQPRQNLGGSAKQEIIVLGPGPGNSVWLYSHAYGLVRYEKGAFRLAPKYPQPCRFEQIQEDGDGTLIVCQERLLRIVGEQVQQLTKDSDQAPIAIRSAVRDEQGRLWIGLVDGGVAKLGDKGQLTSRYGVSEGLPSGAINNLVSAGANGLWIAADRGLALIRNGRVKTFTTRDGLPSDEVRRLAKARDGSLWVGTTGGLALYRDGRFETFQNLPGLPDAPVHSIFEDREDNIWITFSKTGLFRLRKPKFLTWATPEGLLDERPTAIVTSGVTTWITHGKGLQRLRGGKVEEIALDPKPTPLVTLEEDGSGKIWALTLDTAYIVDPYTARSQRVTFPSGTGRLYSISRDQRGRVWIVTAKGLFVGEDNRVEAVPMEGLPTLQPRCAVRQSRDGRLWLSDSKAGLFELRDGKASRVSLSKDPELNRIHTFYIDSNSDFWLGLDGGGLARWRNGKLARYGYQAGKPQNFIYHFAEDTEGNFWLGLRAGLVRISRSSLNDYLDEKTKAEPKEDFFDSTDGLRSFNFGVAARTVFSTEPARVLWFPSLVGAVRIDATDIPINRLVPPVHLERVDADQKSLALGETVKVPAGTGLLRFEFSVASLVNRSHMLVRSRLDPFDSTWRNQHSNTITYSQVPPGEYTFIVSGTNNDGVWNEQGAKIKVVVLPRFYQTWWFRLLVAVAAIASIAALFRWRTMRLRREKVELERRVELRTAELSKAKQIAENSAQAKSDFLATMSHEIRTPLHGVLGTVEVLSDTALTSSQREHLDTVRNSSNSLLRLLNDILDLTKIEAGRMELRLATFSLCRVLEDVAGLLQAQAKMKRIAIVASYDERLPEYFEGDEIRIRQVLFNLAGNAVKFTEQGQVTIEITGEPKLGLAWNLNVAVRDTGIGIPEEIVPQLFQNFVQANSSASRRYGGTGLGLAICDRLAKMMGGSVTVDSKIGQGSTFNFALPLSQTAPVSKRPVAPVQAAGSVRFDSHVLLAEDNPVNQKLAIAMLKRLGCSVTLAKNGKEAVELAHRSSFPIIFMDCQMPEMDGFEATRQIRSQLGGDPVIIAMTANALPGDRERCLEVGMNDYLAKPFQRSDLVRLLSKHLTANPRSNGDSIAASIQSLGQNLARLNTTTNDSMEVTRASDDSHLS